MPATIQAPPDAGVDPFSDLISGGDKSAPEFGAFTDLVPKDSFSSGVKQAGADFGQFSDLVPQSPTSETEKAVADTPDTEKMSDLERLVVGLPPKKPAESNYMKLEKGMERMTGQPIHQTLNALRNLASGAGKYIFNGLQGFEFNRAQILANPPNELIQLHGDELVLPDGSIMSKEQQDALEQKYHDDAIAQIPDAKGTADYFKQLAGNTDTALGVDPELANTIPARLAHTVGSAGTMALESLIPGAGIPLMVVHGALATEAEAKNAGKTDQEAEAAGARSAIGLALFGGASKLAALGVAQILPEGAAPLTKFLSQFTGQEVANETSSRAIDAWNAASDAPEGKKIESALNALKDTTLEQSTLNAVYALAHASKAAGKEPVRPAGAAEPDLLPKTPESQPATVGEPIEQAPKAEVLKPEVAPSAETPTTPEQISRTPFPNFNPDIEVARRTAKNTEGGVYYVVGGKRWKGDAGAMSRIGDDVLLADGSYLNHSLIDAVETPSGNVLWGKNKAPEQTAVLGQTAPKIAPSGASAEDWELKSGFKEQYPAVALKIGDKIISGKPPEVRNHSDLAEKNGFPNNAIPGFLDKNGDFVYQYAEDAPSVPSAPLAATEPGVSSPKSEPIGVADAIAEIQRRNVPEPVQTVEASKPSKIGQSIEAKAVEAKLTEGFSETAGYDPINIQDQAQRATSLIKSSTQKARAILRGDEPLPEGLRGTSLITAMEEHLTRNPSPELAYELANSPLTSATSLAAQEMRLMAERVPDSITAKFQEIREARRAGSKQRGETPERVIQEVKTEIVRQSAKRPTWEAFVRSIECV